MGRQASLSTIPLFFIGALLMLASAHETRASTIEIESEPEYDESSANPFERFLLDSRTGGAATCKATSKRCRKSGGVCVEAGTCKTMEIPGSSCSKIGNFKTANCTCCAKDMSKVCKPKKSCKDLGGFCVVNPKACRGEAILIKGGCNCKGWSGRGSCCKPKVTCDDLKCKPREMCMSYTHTETNTTLGKCICANGFVERDGECIVGGVISDETFIFNFKYADWTGARSQCESKGQKLATIKDIQGFQDFLFSNYAWNHAYDASYEYYGTYDYYLSITFYNWWVGGSDADTEGNWVWTDGTSITDDINWSTDQYEVNTDGKDCMFHYNGTSVPDYCTNTKYYICVVE